MRTSRGSSRCWLSSGSADGRAPAARGARGGRLPARDRGHGALRDRAARRPHGAAAGDRLLLRQVGDLPGRGRAGQRHRPVHGRPPPRLRGAAAGPGVLRPAAGRPRRPHRHAAHVPAHAGGRRPRGGRHRRGGRLGHGGGALAHAAGPGLHRRRALRAGRPGRLRRLARPSMRWRPPRHPRRLQQPRTGRPGTVPRLPSGAGLRAVPGDVRGRLPPRA